MSKNGKKKRLILGNDNCDAISVFHPFLYVHVYHIKCKLTSRNKRGTIVKGDNSSMRKNKRKIQK